MYYDKEMIKKLRTMTNSYALDESQISDSILHLEQEKLNLRILYSNGRP